MKANHKGTLESRAPRMRAPVSLMVLGVRLNIEAGSVIVQELCESRGGRPGLSVLTSLLVSVDVKIY